MLKRTQKRIVLGSKSPRRQELIAQLTNDYEIRIQEVDEVFDPAMPPEEVPAYLAILKANALAEGLGDNELILTADTVVILDQEILGKPVDEADAKQMLRRLSGASHTVITGCCLRDQTREVVFSVATEVRFKELREEEINYYVDHFKPLDKAGSYGIQEYIGLIGIEEIKGSYYNVMGLPVAQLCSELEKFG